jgi:hypothetical protein
MGKKLDFIMHELNPLNDSESIKEGWGVGLPITISAKEFLTEAGSKFYSLFKPIIRGAVIGASFGAIFSIFDNETRKDIVYGLGTGVALDLTQYAIRSAYHYGKNFRE